MTMWDDAGLLREHWYAAALTSEVNARKPHGCVILETPLVLFRTHDGRAACLEDRCAHRNAKLSEGALFDDKIGCPYHGWTYDCEGTLVHVPSEGPRSLPTIQCRVRRFHVVERYGLVWVWMGTAEPTNEPFAMPYWDTPGWGAYYMKTQFANEVTGLVENFMDVPHTTFVHRGWFRSPAAKRVRTIVERTTSSVLVTYDQPSDSIGFTGRILNPDGAPMVHTDKFYMPNVTRVDYEFGERGFVITSTCTPERAFDTRVYTLISYRLGSDGTAARWAHRAARLFLPWYTRRVIEQDVVIMKNHGDNLQRFGGVGRYRNTAADLLHEHIEALREHAQRGGDGEAPEPRTDEIEMWI